MSRIGKIPIPIVPSVEVSLSERVVIVKGPHGVLERKLSPFVNILIEDSVVYVQLKEEFLKKSSFQGLERALINNMVLGVSQKFSKTLLLEGVGYRMNKKGDILDLQIGKSHEVFYKIPADVSIELPNQTTCIVSGIDKQRVGQVSADIRSYLPVEPYKGKGFRYSDEVVRRKSGKSA